MHVLGGLRVGLTHDIDMMPELVLERRTPGGEILRTSPAYHEDLHEGEGPEEVSATACRRLFSLLGCVVTPNGAALQLHPAACEWVGQHLERRFP